MIIILFLSAVANNLEVTQNENWKFIEWNIDPFDYEMDYLITLKKSERSEPVFLLSSIDDFPSISNTWTVSADYHDFQGFATGSSSLFLRIPYQDISNKAKIKISVFKYTNFSLDYSLESSAIAQNTCYRYCKYGSNCISNICKCNDFKYIGFDCSVSTQLINLNEITYQYIPSKSWTFIRSQSTSDTSVRAIFFADIPGIRVYYLNTNSSVIPSMLTCDGSFYLDSQNSAIRLTLGNSDKGTLTWALFCDSSSACKTNFRIVQLEEVDKSYIWIIIVSIMVVIFVCITVPLIFRIYKVIKNRAANKIVDMQTAVRMKDFHSKFPERKFSIKEEKLTCVICLEDLKKGCLVRELMCGHLFHSKCISEWYLANSACPLCKRTVAEDLTLTVQNINQ